ncbi:hypothetical protein HHI36_010706 [Cryptolaemus montrouzieri]|uniref:Peptidase S1 domain-containing protein n=1 Tax=Cryptolaemus montrouzieri TaxID=559131 RepID=A0ABD2MJL2_9CUCU
MYGRLKLFVFVANIFWQISFSFQEDNINEPDFEFQIQPGFSKYAKLLRKPDCGYGNVTSEYELRIVGGIPAKPGEFPWMVNLGYRNAEEPSKPKWLCGGTLISKRHVLTAAHCVYRRPDLYLIRVGDFDLTSKDDMAYPEDIPLDTTSTRLHEHFNPRNYANDIAILKLSRRERRCAVWPICLPVDRALRTKKFAGLKLVVAGWGSTEFNGTSSPILNQVKVPVKTTRSCRKAYEKQNVMIDRRNICAGYAMGNKDACQGDSGGPLMLIEKETNNVRVSQIGIVSYGFRCAEPGYPGVYTRVSFFLDWIERNMV